MLVNDVVVDVVLNELLDDILVIVILHQQRDCQFQLLDSLNDHKYVHFLHDKRFSLFEEIIMLSVLSATVFAAKGSLEYFKFVYPVKLYQMDTLILTTVKVIKFSLVRGSGEVPISDKFGSYPLSVEYEEARPEKGDQKGHNTSHG